MPNKPIVQKTETGTAMLLPAPEGTCEECARAHDPSMPHDAQSMLYQMRFKAKRGRWPTWKDALEHCPPEMKAAWEAELKKRGAWTEPVTSKEEAVLTLVEGHEPVQELPPGAKIPPL